LVPGVIPIQRGTPKPMRRFSPSSMVTELLSGVISSRTSPSTIFLFRRVAMCTLLDSHLDQQILVKVPSPTPVRRTCSLPGSALSRATWSGSVTTPSKSETSGDDQLSRALMRMPGPDSTTRDKSTSESVHIQTRAVRTRPSSAMPPRVKLELEGPRHKVYYVWLSPSPHTGIPLGDSSPLHFAAYSFRYSLSDILRSCRGIR